jgi:hypothetical protein
MSTESGPERLADALEAFLDRPPDGGREATADWLRRHERVAEFLGPMLVRPDGPAPPPPGPGPGARVGRFRLIGELGRGGMGVVFEAREEGSGARVALKVLPETRAWSPQAVARFEREAAAAARLDHPGIVRVLGSGVAEQRHWIAMELVEGRSLREAWLEVRAACDGDPTAVPAEARLGVAGAAGYLDEVLEIGAQIADALAHAHAAGIVHRDVKPQNVLIDADGRARLVDFGLARGDEDATLTRSGDLAGTPHYASPEQIAGAGRGAEGRSDLFSLGVLLHELVAMARPFDGESTAAVLDAIRGTEPRPLRAFVPRVPRGLEILVARLLEKDPARRPASAQLVADDLRALRRGEAVRTRPIPWPVLVGRFARAHPLVVAALAAACVLPSAVALHLHRTRAAVAAEQVVTARHYERARQTIVDLMQEVAAVDLDTAPGMQSLRMRLFRDAREGFRALAAERPDDAEVALLGARATGGLAEALFELGRPAAALPEFDAAIAAFEALPASLAGQVAVRFELAGRRADRAAAQELLGAPAAAEADLGLALAGWEQLAAAAAGQPIEAQARVAIARTLTRFAGLRCGRDPDGARVHLEAARAAWAAVGPGPDRLEIERAHADLVEAGLCFVAGDLDGAGRHAEAAAVAFAAIPGGERSIRLAMLRAANDAQRARIAAARGEAGLAAGHAERALDGLDALVRADPDANAPRRARAQLRVAEAERLLRGGDLALAEAELDAAVADLDRVAAADPGGGGLLGERLVACQIRAAIEQEARPGEAAPIEALLAEGEGLFAAMREAGPPWPAARSIFGSLLGNHARWLIAMAPVRDLPRAAVLLERAEAEQRAVLAAAPRHLAARAALWVHLRLRSATALAMRDRPAALRALEAGLALAGSAGDGLALLDTMLRAGERDRAAAAFAHLAGRGLVTAEHLRREPRLAGLRGHPDLAGFERGGGR